MPDHVHMLVSIPPKISVASFMGYLKGKSSLMMFDRHANLKYKFGNRHFWAEEYYVSTVGLNDATVKKYIRDQERADIMQNKMSVKEAEASVFRRWLVTRAYSPHPEPPVLRVEAISCTNFWTECSNPSLEYTLWLLFRSVP